MVGQLNFPREFIHIYVFIKCRSIKNKRVTHRTMQNYLNSTSIQVLHQNIQYRNQHRIAWISSVILIERGRTSSISSCCPVAAARTAAQISTAQLEVLDRLLRANGTPSSQGLLHPRLEELWTIWQWHDMKCRTIQIRRSVCTTCLTAQRILIFILGKLRWFSLSRSRSLLRTCLVWTGFCSHTARIWQSCAGLLPVSVAATSRLLDLQRLRFAYILILSHTTFCKCTDENIQ